MWSNLLEENKGKEFKNDLDDASFLDFQIPNEISLREEQPFLFTERNDDFSVSKAVPSAVYWWLLEGYSPSIKFSQLPFYIILVAIPQYFFWLKTSQFLHGSQKSCNSPQLAIFANKFY